MRLLLALAALLFLCRTGFAEDCPNPGTVVFGSLTGAQLQDSLRVRYRPPVGLSYAGARDVLYTLIDNHDGMLTGIYTGFTAAVDPNSPAPRDDAFQRGINAEHTWPQSRGAENLPARADMHHLRPGEIAANNARASHPFDEIPDQETDSWYRLRDVTGTPNPVFLDEYSELDLGKPPSGYQGRWEVREDMKGDVARGMFYFYTVYRAEATAADPRFFDVQKDVLRAWHIEDPADSGEHTRTCAIAPYQAGKVNPFVIDPTLVDRAYFGGVPVTWVWFAVVGAPNGVRLRWRVADENEHAGFNVVRGSGSGEEQVNSGLLFGGEFLDRSGTPGRRYDYWIEAVGRDGSRDRFGPPAVVYPAAITRAVAEPNPARAGGDVRFMLTGVPADRVEVFDAAGRATVLGPAGIYFVRLSSGAHTATLRLTVLP